MKRLLVLTVLLAWSTIATAHETKMGDDGLHKQDWFLNSFLDLKDDLAEATKSGKRFAIVWEQKGCPYCADMHVINFADDKLRTWIKDHYVVLQLNLWGSREVTDFDGQVLPEKELARKYRITFTPTVQYFPESVAEMAGKKGADGEVARLPGYFRNGHFLGMFEYVWDKRYAKGQDFQRYIIEKSEARQPSR
ncbi:thioredoxin [Paramagnetospirillum kuznetsovii]|uniref:Thioredoxin n=1 Tax=Paramagnetospirillum kuznetsovii TaxID=2053833 RepID=A0A364NUX3_9PROT|nr:thioredoxin family protein [Paramagnetospirillum kuznetsovii]RAU20863.1 thioredoxin [Paramagnetospirillum kuznetsovii]